MSFGVRPADKLNCPVMLQEVRTTLENRRMQAHPAIRKQLFLLGAASVAFQFSGCGPSMPDAIKFANQQTNQLKKQNRKTVQRDNGKWYSEAMEVRNATPGSKQHGTGGAKAWISYEYRILRSPEFDTESEARDAALSPVNEAWESKEELFAFKDGKWKPIE